MPRISGRSGSVFDLPMRPRPSARSVPRVFGLAWVPDFTWVTTIVVVGLLGHQALASASSAPLGALAVWAPRLRSL